MKMLPGPLWLLCLSVANVRAQSDETTDDFYTGTLETVSNPSSTAFTGSDYTYLTVSGQTTVDSSAAAASASAASDSQSTRTATSASLTQIGGSNNGTASTTTSSATATNTVPCNGFPEFCTRSYSNITQVCAHNSAFVVENNAGSNQALSVEDQLNDGIRMIQGETQWANGTFHNCHTSCELLNAGTLQAEMEVVANWVLRHPYDVVTWLIVNSDFRPVEDYVPVIQNSGLGQFLYEPDYVPQRRDQWPTLQDMIFSGKRVVMFMDYEANQSSVPYILDEFTHMWETPFSPTNQSFPCTQQRPPKLNQTKARDEYMYLANHNLNTAIDLSAIIGSSGDQNQILIPNTAEINNTNGQLNQFGQLGAMSESCTSDWGRPPNFLLVDFYNYGYPERGSVFHVAAAANNVTYNGKCCGLGESGAPTLRSGSFACFILVFSAILLSW